MLSYALGILVGYLITVLVIYYSFPNKEFPCLCPETEYDLIQKSLDGDEDAQRRLEEILKAEPPVRELPISVNFLLFLGFVSAIFVAYYFYKKNKEKQSATSEQA